MQETVVHQSKVPLMPLGRNPEKRLALRIQTQLDKRLTGNPDFAFTRDIVDVNREYRIVVEAQDYRWRNEAPGAATVIVRDGPEVDVEAEKQFPETLLDEIIDILENMKR